MEPNSTLGRGLGGGVAPDCHVQAVDSDSLLRSGAQQVQEVHLDASDTDLQLGCGDGPEAGASTTGEIARHFYRV